MLQEHDSEFKMPYENRTYAIFNIEEIEKINFNEVLETSKETLRKNVNQTKTFVKWEGETPPSILQLETIENYLNHQEIIQILSTEEWTIEQEMN